MPCEYHCRPLEGNKSLHFSWPVVCCLWFENSSIIPLVIIVLNTPKYFKWVQKETYYSAFWTYRNIQVILDKIVALNSDKLSLLICHQILLLLNRNWADKMFIIWMTVWVNDILVSVFCKWCYKYIWYIWKYISLLLYKAVVLATYYLWLFCVHFNFPTCFGYVVLCFICINNSNIFI